MLLNCQQALFFLLRLDAFKMESFSMYNGKWVPNQPAREDFGDSSSLPEGTERCFGIRQSVLNFFKYPVI